MRDASPIRIAGAALALWVLPAASLAAEIEWTRLSSAAGELPVPSGGSTQQTGCVVADFDKDGRNDFLVSCRQKPPALLLYRRTASGWAQQAVEKEYLAIEAGGAEDAQEP